MSRRAYDGEVGTQRWIDLDGVANMRDLGGLPTRDGGMTAPRRLIRSDHLQDLTARDIGRLVSEVGVTDVLDLRTEVELTLTGPGPLSRIDSLTHHHHSLIDTTARSATVATTVAAALASRPTTERDADFWTRHYLGYLERRGDAVSAALHVIADSRGATIVHCAAGKDRTGTVVGLALDVAGVPHEEIVADYALSAERLHRILERLRRLDFYGDSLRTQRPEDQMPRAETMRAILSTLTEQYGGAAGWLRGRGWSGADLARLRHRLVA